MQPTTPATPNTTPKKTDPSLKIAVGAVLGIAVVTALLVILRDSKNAGFDANEKWGMAGVVGFFILLAGGAIWYQKRTDRIMAAKQKAAAEAAAAAGQGTPQ